MATQKEEQMDNLHLFQKRMEILAGAKLRETDRMNSAVKIQDVVRSKIGAWHGSEEIRRWRETRKS